MEPAHVRVLSVSSTVQCTVNRFFISNAPIGHICYAYPEEMQKQRGQYGAKVFLSRTVGAGQGEARD